MDEVSSRVRLDLLPVSRQGRRKDCSASSSNPMMEGPGADSEEKHEPVSDIDIAVVDSLKCLTPNGRLEKRQTRSALLLKSTSCPRRSLDRISDDHDAHRHHADQLKRKECEA
jgi:hypothetical protein